MAAAQTVGNIDSRNITSDMLAIGVVGVVCECNRIAALNASHCILHTQTLLQFT